MQERSEIGFCEHHNEVVDLSMFEWKGCWSCHYFREENFPFIDVTEAADILGISRSTIIRWIRNGKANGRLFERGRRLSILSPPNKKYFLTKESFEKLKNSEELANSKKRGDAVRKANVMRKTKKPSTKEQENHPKIRIWNIMEG